MKFLVTGGAGFIGSHVCERLLESGHAVTALDDLNDFYDPALKLANLSDIKTKGGDFHFIKGDITQREEVDEVLGGSRFDQIIHLAARGGVRPSLQDPASYHRVNVEGTVNVLEAARHYGVLKVLLASSSSVYGLNNKAPFAENEPMLRPISPYAASKLACESLGHVYHHLYKMDVAVLRFFTVYGPRQRPDLAIHKFTRMIEFGKPVPFYGDGQSSRDYTYISDILDGIMAATRKKFGYEVINLGGSRSISLSRLIQLLEASLHKTAVLNRMPQQPGDVLATCADIRKARKLLGYRPMISVEQGIPMFVDWIKSCWAVA